MTGPHRHPTVETLTHHAKNAKARAAAHATQLRSKLNGTLNGTLNGRTLTRLTGGMAVSAALVTGIAATTTVSDHSAPHTDPNTAVQTDQNTSDLLPANPKIELPDIAAPMPKPKKAITHPHKPVKATDVINLAEQQVGIAETNGHGGGTKFQNWYAGSDFAKKTAARDGATPTAYKDAAWCAMFITWLGDNLNFNDQIGGDAYTVTMATWFNHHNRFGHTPKPGAIVFYDWNGGKTINGIDHVGLVTKVNTDGTINTIEGNISDSVVKKTRTLDKVTGFGYPDYGK
jgi:CHAP domain-containing protein